jgi:uncharacterized membrane protein YadS
MGLVNTALLMGVPQFHSLWLRLDQQILTLANFLMAMAMAGLGLQVDMTTLRKDGLVAIRVAVIGWGALLVVAGTVMYLLNL